MPETRSRFVLLVLAVVLAALPAAADAILSQARGPVLLAAERSPAPTLQPLADGTALRLDQGAEALVLCAGDRAVRLTGPADWTVGAAGCAEGRAVAAGTYARLVPAPGRSRDFHGGLLAEASSRSDDAASKVAVLLTPRSSQRGTALLSEASPQIVWAEVTGALTYRLVLTREGAAEQLHEVAAARAECRPDLRSAPATACRAAWPWRPLSVGDTVSLEVRTATADPDWPLRRSDPSRLRLADAAVVRRVGRELAALQGAGLPAATEEVLRAGVYADAELFNDAAAALEASLEDTPQPSVALRLGDLYLGLGLQRSALERYQRAERMLTSGGPPALRAALHLGYGRLYARGDDPYVALEHLTRAAKLFRRAGDPEGERTATAEAERIEREGA